MPEVSFPIWWYQEYGLNFSTENLNENIDLLSDLYVAVFEKLNT